MNYWYINTEAKAFHGKSPHKQWLKHGRAFVSGVAGTMRQHLRGSSDNSSVVMFSSCMQIPGVSWLLAGSLNRVLGNHPILH